MPCHIIRGPGGAVGIGCSRTSGRQSTCSTPGCKGKTVALCDYPVGARGRTCSARMCATHRWPQDEPDRDFCPLHKDSPKVPVDP